MSFDLKKNFGTDNKLEENGKWEDLGGGARVLVARAGNTKYQEAYVKIPLAMRNQMENGRLPVETSRVIIAELMAKTILLDWEGLVDNGEPIEYSGENAKKMFLSYPDFRQFIWDLSNNQQRFYNDAVEELVKN